MSSFETTDECLSPWEGRQHTQYRKSRVRAHELQDCPNDAPNDISPQLIDYKSKLDGLPECGDSSQWLEQEVVTASFTASRSSIALS